MSLARTLWLSFRRECIRYASPPVLSCETRWHWLWSELLLEAAESEFPFLFVRSYNQIKDRKHSSEIFFESGQSWVVLIHSLALFYKQGFWLLILRHLHSQRLSFQPVLGSWAASLLVIFIDLVVQLLCVASIKVFSTIRAILNWIRVTSVFWNHPVRH